MKKTIALLIAIILSLSLFAGCKQDIKVTEENVAKLFKPSLEAYVYCCGSYFYELEKDERGDLVEYPWDKMKDYFKASIYSCYKIETKITVKEIEEKLNKYTSIGILDKNYFAEIDGNLYVGISVIDSPFYDLNNIKLYKVENDKYYISVDIYYEGAEDDINTGKDGMKYSGSMIFITSLKDDILYIEDIDENIIRDDINPEAERYYISIFDKFYRDILNENNGLEEKLS